MVIDFIKAILTYHVNHYLYEIIIILIILVLGIAIALLKKKFHKESSYTRYIRQDMALFFLAQLSGSIMLLIFQQEMQFLLISILLFLFALLLLRNLSFPLVYIITALICVSILLCCLGLMHLDMFWVYFILRICCVIINIAIVSDLLLFILSKKLKKKAEPKHVFRQSLLIILCFVLFIMPSNLNFVNASGYDKNILNLSSGNKSQDNNQNDNNNIVNSNNSSNQQDSIQTMLTLDRNQILTEEADYIYNYSLENLDNYSTPHLNCHEFKTWYLNHNNYQNEILNSVIELTENYKINPSYLFTYILKYNSDKSKFTRDSNTTISNYNLAIDFSAWDSQELEPKAYTSGIYSELMKNFSMLSTESTSLPLSLDENPFYSYFAFCDEQAVYFVTLYLTLDENNQITESEYTLLEFIDFNQESEQITITNYATELQAIYDTAFRNDFAKDSGRYDMILQEEDNTVYFRRYYCKYTR